MYLHFYDGQPHPSLMVSVLGRLEQLLLEFLLRLKLLAYLYLTVNTHNNMILFFWTTMASHILYINHIIFRADFFVYT